MDEPEDPGCTTEIKDDFFKIRGNERVYKEALLAAYSFNQRLIKNRKSREPFVDSQTKIVQTKDSFAVSRYQRKKLDDSRTNYIFEYSLPNWLKRKRYIFYPNDGYSFSSNIKSQSEDNSFFLDNGILPLNGASNSSLNQYLKQEVDNEDSQLASLSNIFQDDNVDFEENDDSDDNDYEDTRKKKKKGLKLKKKSDSINLGEEKPFACDRCGVKYKTKPGLTYHIQKAHSNHGNQSLTQNNSGVFNQNSVKSDSVNQDENTNSMLGFDECSNSNTNISNPQGNQQYHYNY